MSTQPGGEISAFSASPLYVQLANLLRDQIERGTLRRGEPIPSEAELCQRFEVSRATVRQALGLLVEEGLVVRRRGRGSTVAPRQPLSYAVTELRGFMEGLSAQGLEPRAELLACETLAPPTEIAQLLELGEADRVVHIERLILVDEGPMLLDAAYLSNRALPGLTRALLVERPIYQLLEASLGIPIALVRQTISAVSAGAREAQMLGLRPADPLLQVTRLAYLDRARPLLYGIGLYRADRYQERLWLRRPGTPASALAAFDRPSGRLSR